VKQRVDALIAGGGVMGSAIAWALAGRGVTDVCVLDVDLEGRRGPRLHSWPVRSCWDQALNVRVGAASMRFLSEASGVELSRDGHLWLCDGTAGLESETARMKILRDRGIASEVLDAETLAKRFPLLERAAQVGCGALHVSSDASVDPIAVRDWFRREARNRGVTFLDRAYLEGVTTSSREPGTRRLECAHVVELASREGGSPDEAELLNALIAHAPPRTASSRVLRIQPGIVINALGAWSSLLRVKLGAAGLCVPRSRALAVLSLVGHEGRGALGRWPSLVVDPSGAFFFADSAYTIAGLESLPMPGSFDLAYPGQSFFEDGLWPHLATQAEPFERVHHLRGVTFLEAVTPDGSGVLGRMPGYSNVFEAFGFPGSGLSHAFAIARGLAERIVDGRFDSLDLGPFDSARFSQEARLSEKCIF